MMSIKIILFSWNPCRVAAKTAEGEAIGTIDHQGIGQLEVGATSIHAHILVVIVEHVVSANIEAERLSCSRLTDENVLTKSTYMVPTV